MVGDKKNFRLLIQILLTVIVHKEAKFYLKLAILYFLKIQYSREQKHVSFSDTPMLLIEINSISNMGCQK